MSMLMFFVSLFLGAIVCFGLIFASVFAGYCEAKKKMSQNDED